jgi:catechol 2,3-dioxygenase-like lactoylglutathione lyase family enzyme
MKLPVGPFLAALTAAFAAVFAPAIRAQSKAATEALPAPGFHHLHLNSTNPAAAIDFYARQFPSTSKATFAGKPALKAGNVFVLFNKVSRPPSNLPQSALWHFGWHVTDVHKSLETYQQRKEVKLLPLYTTGEGGFVYTSSDTWPGANGSLGRTKAEIAEAKAKGIQPTHGAGFAYLEGPDGAIVEYQGDMPAERFNHVHLFQEHPFCAALWYQKHLHAPMPPAAQGRSAYTEDNCKVPRPELSWPSLERGGMLRQPAGVTYDNVAVTWHVQQNDQPLVSSRGHVMDHFALSVANLDVWMARLRSEGIQFLEKPYKLGDLRAVMIEGPSKEAIELVEVK